MVKEKNYHYRDQIAEAIPNYFFIYDAKGQEVIYLTESFQKYIVKNSQGSDFSQMRSLLHEKYRELFDNIFNQINEGNFLQDEELRLIDSQEKEKWISIKTYPVVENEKKLIAGHVVDITAKVLHLQDLKKETEELEHIAHVMAHDLRAPLGSIINLQEMLSAEIKEKNYDNAEVYAAMNDRIARDMGTTIDSMIEMIELSSERFQLQKAEINVSALLRRITEQHRFDMEFKGIEFQITLPPLDIKAELDPVKFSLIVKNLLTNAIKFTDKGGKIILSAEENEDDLIVNVKDTGIGIPENKKDQVFDKFTKMKRSGTKGEKSNGLGLSIAKKITEIHNGGITLLSKQGEGSTFRVTIPKD